MPVFLSQALGSVAVMTWYFAVFVVLTPLVSTAAARAAQPSFTVSVQAGSGAGASDPVRSVTFQQTALRRAQRFDVQDGRKHNVRGVSLRAVVSRARVPDTVDAAVFVYTDGMQIPVHLNDRREVDAIFIAFEHGDEHDQFTANYPVHGKPDQPCPKVVYGNAIVAYSIWLYPTQLAAIKLVNWKQYEYQLAQATRSLPTRGAGWPLFVRHCQPCHGIGQRGATRGADFLSNMPAYGRIPAWSVTDAGPHPRLHEKIKGFSDGSIPVLNHISDADMATLWSWLHALHDAAAK